MEVSLTSLNRKRGLCTLGGGPRRGLGMGVLLSHSHSGYRKEPQWGLERWLRQILVPNRGLSGVGCGNLEEVGVTSVVWGRGNLNGVEKQWWKSLSSLANSRALGSGRNSVSLEGRWGG